MQTQESNKPFQSSDIPQAYRDTRLRVMELVRELSEDELASPVHACPGWSVRDVVAHLAANAEDMIAGSMTGAPTEDQTAAQLVRMRGRALSQILDGWARDAAELEAEVPGPAMRLPLIDVTSHEHDIRGGLGRPGARDSEAVRICSQFLLEAMRPPVPVRIVVEDAEFRVGPEEGDELVLATSRFDALRWRMGRRSPAQLAAMQWSADPTHVLGNLVVFGPAKTDVVE